MSDNRKGGAMSLSEENNYTTDYMIKSFEYGGNRCTRILDCEPDAENRNDLYI